MMKTTRDCIFSQGSAVTTLTRPVPAPQLLTQDRRDLPIVMLPRDSLPSPSVRSPP